MELNVLVLGMPNVGKSTLLNALRNMGIKGRKFLLAYVVIFLAVGLFCESYGQEHRRLFRLLRIRE